MTTSVTSPAQTPESDQLAHLPALSQAFMRAARAWTLYPAAHPSASAPLDALQRVLRMATATRPLRLTVTPDALLIDDSMTERPVPQIAETAGFLHDRDILEIVFQPGLSHAELRALMQLLKLDIETVRTRGGPEAAWKQVACPSIRIRQVDYGRLVERTTDSSGPRRDDLWRSIVRSVRGSGALDSAAQRRLFEVSHDVEAMEALVEDVRMPLCAADGSPLVSAQGAAVRESYRRMTDVVGLQAPDRIDGAARAMATVASRLPPAVALEMLRSDDDLRPDGSSVQERVVGAMDDQTLGTLLAGAVTAQGTTDRLHGIVKLFGDDPTRVQGVLTSAREALTRAHADEPKTFERLSGMLEQLATGSNATAYNPTLYGGQLQGAAERARAMSLTDLPDELPGWLETVDANHVRRLSVTLLCDLLRLECEEARAASIVDELRGIAEDLLLSGDFEVALEIVQVLGGIRGAAGLGQRAARASLQHIATGAVLQETVSSIGDIPESAFRLLRRICLELGPGAVESLRTGLIGDVALHPRLVEIMAGYGPVGIEGLAPLVVHPDVAVQTRLAELLGRLGFPKGIPLLEKLLPSLRPQVVAEAVRAIALIDDPSGSRVLQAYLRQATATQRDAAVRALLERTPQAAVPVLIRILDDCDLLGSDHGLALETLAVIKRLADPRAVPGVARAMRVRSWFRRARRRAIKARAVEALVSIRSGGATAALTEAGVSGDRMLRRMARAALRSMTDSAESRS